MDKTSVFITTSNIGYGTGGGNVCYNICHALQTFTNLKQILCHGNTDLASSCKNIYPPDYDLPDNPFLYDYIASELVTPFVDIAHFYGNPFGKTVERIKKYNPNARIIVDCPAHNLELSIEEHMKLYGSYPYPHMTNPLLWRAYIKHMTKANLIITPSKLSRDYIVSGRPFTKIFNHRPNIEIIPHGTNLPDEKEIKPYPEEFTPGYIGQYGPDKGVIYLVSAWTTSPLSEKHKMLLAGLSSLQIADKIKNKFRILGRVKHIREFYNQISIYIQPSITEGFGLPVLEAMSYGRPVIVTEGVGAKDIVTEGYDGFIIPIRNPELLQKRIQYFYNNPDEIKRMGKNAREKAKNYSWKTIRERYKDAISKL
mgnify:CR=1 FL=1